MNRTFGEAGGGTVESSPSVGLAVVDSMVARRIKALASHAQGFPEPPQHRTFDRLREAKSRPSPIAGLTRVFAGGITQDLGGFRASAIACQATGWYSPASRPSFVSPKPDE
jgi:hypothetical protein